MQPNRRLVQGFTLLELLVVITILAALGGSAIVAAGNMRENALRQIALMEIQKIKQALLQYRQDIGNFHTPDNPADFRALYEQGSLPTWDMASARGWRGPYLTTVGEGLVDIGDGLALNGSGDPFAGTAKNEQRGVADPFVAAPVKNGSYIACDDSDGDADCLLDWRTTTLQRRHTRWGRPYLLFDPTDPARARLVSMGPDGRYAGVNATNPCAPFDSSDDLVLCLLR